MIGLPPFYFGLMTLEFLLDYGLFLAKTLTILVALLILMVVSVGMSHRGKQTEKGHIEVRSVNDGMNQLTSNLKQVVLDPEVRKLETKSEKKQAKQEQKERKKEAKEGLDPKTRVFVVEFEGDVQASGVAGLREEITAILSVAAESDEVVLKLESPGGLVHSYGLAASQLQRIVDRNVALTISVDKVAASGGYMMACIGKKIIAAPFALLGSIGVVAQVPNFHRLLKSKEIDVEVLTAGEYKRTLTMFGENTDKGREKFVEELEDVHTLFKDFVADHRPQVNIDEVSTGEAWYGKRALERNLVDELVTSDEYIYDKCESCDVFVVKYVENQNRVDKVLERFTAALARIRSPEELRQTAVAQMNPERFKV